jgi:murein DD-endopeptidase MepM/ murein hydrolase activator NlpD
MRFRRAALALSLLASFPAAADTLERGRQLTDLLYASDIDTLWDDFSPHLQQAFSGKGGLRAFRKKVSYDFGEEQRIIEEEVHRHPVTTYVRSGTFSRFGGAIELTWTFDQDGKATSVAVHPAATEAPSKFTGHITKTPLRLPFRGAWTVLWGGRTVAENRHAVSADMRYAYDFLVVRGEKSFEGDGAHREQYYCWGRPILAPGDGLVVEAVSDIPDNTPGMVNPETLYGNHIVLDHGNGEVSLLAHLQRGSLQVQRGQAVRQGDVLARCGNSGTSTEPHLHYQLMNGRRYLKSFGLPAQFQSYLADGQRVSRGEPTRGQVIEAIEPSNATGSRE